MTDTNKIIVLTGGATGIGAATVKLLASKGATVYVLDLKPLSYEVANVEYLHCDVANFQEVNACVQKIVAKEKRIDSCVANAGIHLVANLEETSLDQIDQLINVNIKGVIYVLKAVLPIMKKRRQGQIVLVGSEQSLIAKRSNAVYGLTKGAIGQLTKSTAIDYADYNIKVNCVCPGTTDTPLVRQAMTQVVQANQATEEDVEQAFSSAQPMNRMGKPEEVAKVIEFLCSHETTFMTGSLVSVDGGYTAQ